MEFELSTVNLYYSNQEAEKLKKLGFRFRDTSDQIGESIFDTNRFMQIQCDDLPTIELETMGDLMVFMAKWGKVILIPSRKGRKPRLEIYDGYRE